MAMVVPHVGEIEILKRVLYGNAGAENLVLKLFQNNVTPSATDTASTYTEATFTGYSAVTLTSSQAGGTWSVPTTDANGNTTSTYGTVATWTAGSAQTIYGYYVIGATSGLLYWAEAFANPKVLAINDPVTIQPRLQAI
jgi:hypothetical protein